MAIKRIDGWECSYCRKLHKTSINADICRDSHDIIYIGFSAEDLNRLGRFLYSGDLKLVTEGMLIAVKSGLKRAVLGKKDYEE